MAGEVSVNEPRQWHPPLLAPNSLYCTCRMFHWLRMMMMCSWSDMMGRSGFVLYSHSSCSALHCPAVYWPHTGMRKLEHCVTKCCFSTLILFCFVVQYITLFWRRRHTVRIMPRSLRVGQSEYAIDTIFPTNVTFRYILNTSVILYPAGMKPNHYWYCFIEVSAKGYRDWTSK